jgi:uncharacterized oligopeptide transporter (OPT) family protein
MIGFGFDQWVALIAGILISGYAIMAPMHGRVVRILVLLAGLCAIVAAFVGSQVIPVAGMIVLLVVATVVHQLDIRRRRNSALPRD